MHEHSQHMHLAHGMDPHTALCTWHRLARSPVYHAGHMAKYPESMMALSSVLQKHEWLKIKSLLQLPQPCSLSKSHWVGWAPRK